MDMNDTAFIIRSKRGSYNNERTVLPPTTRARNTQDENGPSRFLVEWEVVNYSRVSPFGMELVIFVEAYWGDEQLAWQVTKTSDQLFRVDPASKKSIPVSHNKLALSSKTDEEFLQVLEESLAVSSTSNPKAVLRFFEASRWTFAKENVYNESRGPKLKEGDLVKAPGGYESYNRSRWRVLLAQGMTIVISLSLWATLGEYWMLYLGFGIISFLSLLHWSYYRLSAIDATCIIPCLFLPPVGPILILVWTVFGFLFARGDQRWFVLRQGHLEFYEAWDSPKREPLGVLLLDRYTRVRKSLLFPNQLIIATPYRSLRVWASSKRERDDWVRKIATCIEVEFGSRRGSNELDSGIESSFAPMRDATPVKHLIDGRAAFEEIYKAILGAKKEIFIAGWMLSPELYLLREGIATGRALPEDDQGLFQTRKVTRIEPGSKHMYQCPITSPTAVTLTSYEFIVTKEVNDRPIRARWVIRGLSVVTGEWMELSREQDINMQLICDAMEPLRFRVLSHTGRKVVCSAFEFSFFEREYEDNLVLESKQLASNDDWVNVHANDAKEGDDDRGFLCGGVRLFYSEEDSVPKPIASASVPILEKDASDSLMDRFFRLFARTEQESQLDRLYRVFTGRSTTLPLGSIKEDEEDVEAMRSINDDDDRLPIIANAMTPFELAANAASYREPRTVGNKFSDEFHSRLDRVIAKKVLEDGLRCYILVYRDVDLFLPNASASAKRKLLASALWNRNIQVIRHAPEGRSYGSVQHFFTCSLSRGKTWWSHHEKLICVDQSVAFVGGLDLAFGRYDDAEHSLWDHARRVWKGQDYYNPHFRDFERLEHAPYVDAIFRGQVPRMPWHDVHCRVEGRAAVDLARHFIGRWNAEKRELKPGSDRFTVLLPRYPATQNVAAAQLDRNHPTPHLCQCQVLRSVSAWSSPSKTESSVLHAYEKLIRESEKFVYIEQQFFSSGLAGTPVRNAIAQTLANRVCKAVINGEPFKAVIIMPIIPAFEGAIAANGSARSVLHWNLRTIRKTWEYIDKILGTSEAKARARNVLGFFSLRKVERNVEYGEYQTEQIYVHSKLLIVDDAFTVIGSANLNDRSMLGTRDSEIAVLIKSVPFSRSLRLKLYAEHAGGMETDWSDPLTAEWDAVAWRNTHIVERMFADVPRDSFRSLEHLGRLVNVNSCLGSPREREELFRDLRGHLVRFPIGFLSEEKMLLPRVVRGERESVLPLENFT